jgi:hypothetical protein
MSNSIVSKMDSRRRKAPKPARTTKGNKHCQPEPCIPAITFSSGARIDGIGQAGVHSQCAGDPLHLPKPLGILRFTGSVARPLTGSMAPRAGYSIRRTAAPDGGVVALRLHHGRWRIDSRSYIGWLGGRLLLAAVMAGVATFAGGALGGLLSGFECRALTSNDTSQLPPLAATICGSLLGFGTACLGTGVAVGLLMATTGWRRSASDPASASAYQWPEDGRRAPTPGAPPASVAWLLVPAFLLIVTLLTTWLAASPAIHFVALHFATLSHGLDGLLLMPPGFTIGTAGTLLLGELGLLLLLSARSPLFPRTYALLAVAHLGLIVCNRSLLGAIRSISEPAGSELPILQTVSRLSRRPCRV